MNEILGKKPSQEETSGVVGAETENPEADLVSHADYIEEGAQASPQKSDAGRKPSAIVVKSSADEEGQCGGGAGAGGKGLDEAANLRLARYHARERRVVMLSRRLLNFFYLVGTIFAGERRKAGFACAFRPSSLLICLHPTPLPIHIRNCPLAANCPEITKACHRMECSRDLC